MVLLQIMRQINDEAPRYGVDLVANYRLVYGVEPDGYFSGKSALDGVYKLTAVKMRSGLLQ